MLPEEFKREFDGCRGMVEERLRLYFTEGSALSDAMSYSL